MRNIMSKWFVVVLMSCSFSCFAVDDTVDCDNVSSTMGINYCASMTLEAAKVELNRYLEASLEHNAADPELIESIKVAQKGWQTYANAHCDAIYTKWRDGTVRGVMSITCHTRLTEQRTHEIWRSFLTYMDGAPPILPEPKE